jgi:hypothetical protein
MKSISVCQDCLIAITNGDFSGMDEGQAEATEKGMYRLTGSHRVYLIAGDTEHGFSVNKCDCCRSKMHGDRFEALVMLK